MLTLELILTYLLIRTLLNKDIAEQLVESFASITELGKVTEFGEKVTEHILGVAGYSRLKSICGKLSNLIVKDRIWKEIRKIGEEVFILVLGHETYNRISPFLKKIKTREQFFKLLKDNGVEKPEEKLIEIMSEASKNVMVKMSEDMVGIVLFHLRELVKENRELLEGINKEIKKLSEDYDLKNLEDIIGVFDSRNLYVPYSLYVEEKKDLIEEFKKYKFVQRHVDGRDAFEYLNDFLSSDKKALILEGEGGSGKTRLAFEFAERMREEWNIYFVERYRHFIPYNFDEKTLLIVDDATRTFSLSGFGLEDLIKFTGKAKIFILDRPYNVDSLKRRLEAEHVNFYRAELGEKKDVYSLLKNLGIEGKVAEEIVKASGGIFYYTILLAEYYRKEKVVSLDEALKNRYSMYVLEIAEIFNGNDDLAEYILSVVSLIMPLNRDDLIRLYEEGIITDEEKSHFIRLIREANRFKGLLTKENGGVKVYPDPLADYIRFRFLDKIKFDAKELEGFLKHMPFRISANVWGVGSVVMSKHLAGKEEEFQGLRLKHLKLLNDIFRTLNKMDFEVKNAVEYFQAMALFTGLSPFIEQEPSLEKWEEVYSESPDDEVLEWLAKALTNATAYYGEKEELEKMKRCLDRLEELYGKTEKDEVLVPLAGALYNSALNYGKKEELEKMQRCLDRLEELYEKNPVIEPLVSDLLNEVYGEFKVKKQRKRS